MDHEDPTVYMYIYRVIYIYIYHEYMTVILKTHT